MPIAATLKYRLALSLISALLFDCFSRIVGRAGDGRWRRATRALGRILHSPRVSAMAFPWVGREAARRPVPAAS
jgi:hypothetical protein